jgi:hypothetical protein
MRVGDLGLGDFVRVECVCGHVQMLTGAMLLLYGLIRMLRCWPESVGQHDPGEMRYSYL